MLSSNPPDDHLHWQFRHAKVRVVSHNFLKEYTVAYINFVIDYVVHFTCGASQQIHISWMGIIKQVQNCYRTLKKGRQTKLFPIQLFLVIYSREFSPGDWVTISITGTTLLSVLLHMATPRIVWEVPRMLWKITGHTCWDQLRPPHQFC